MKMLKLICLFVLCAGLFAAQLKAAPSDDARLPLITSMVEEDFGHWQGLLDQWSNLEALGLYDVYSDKPMGLIHYFTKQEDGRFLNYLITKHSAVNLKDAIGNTALHIAAEYDRPNNIKTLLNAGADINLINGKGLTALQVAQGQGFEQVISQLREFGAIDLSLTAYQSSQVLKGRELVYQSTQGRMNKMELNAAGTSLAVLSDESQRLDIYDPKLAQSLGWVEFDQIVEDLAFSPDGKRLYVLLGRQLSEFDLTQNQSMPFKANKTVDLPSHYMQLAVNPLGGELVLTNGSLLLSVDLQASHLTEQFLDIETGQFVSYLAFTVSGNTLYVAGYGGVAILQKNTGEQGWQQVQLFPVNASNYEVVGENLLLQLSGMDTTLSFVQINKRAETVKSFSTHSNEPFFWQSDITIQFFNEHVFLFEYFDQVMMINDEGRFQKLPFKPYKFSDFIYHKKLGYLLLDESEVRLVDAAGFLRFRVVPGQILPALQASFDGAEVKVLQGKLVWSDNKSTKLPGLKSDVNISALDINGDKMAVGYADGSYSLWRLKQSRKTRKGKLIETQDNYLSGKVSSIKLTNNGKTVFLGGLGRIAKINIGLKDDGLLLRGHESDVNLLRLSSDESLLVTSALDASIRFWSTSDGRLIHTEHFTGGWLSEMRLDAGATLILHANGPGISNFSVDLTQLQETIDNPVPAFSPQTTSTSSISKIVYNPLGTQMASLDGAIVRVRDLKTDLLLQQLFPKAGFVNDLTYTRDGQSLILAVGEKLEYWDPFTGQLQKIVDLSLFGASIHNIRAFSTKNLLVASNHHGWHNPMLLHANTGKLVGYIDFSKYTGDSSERVLEVALSQSDQRMAIYGSLNIRVFQLEGTKYELIATLPRREAEMQSKYARTYISFSPDERRITYLSFENGSQTVVYDIDLGKEQLRMSGGLATFVDDTALVYMRSTTQLAKYDLEQDTMENFGGDNPALLNLHQEVISALAFNPNSKLLVSADIWGNRVLWNPKTGTKIHNSNRFDNDIYTAEMSADGRYLAYNNKQGLHLYDLRHLTHHKLEATNYPYFGKFSGDSQQFFYRDEGQYHVMDLASFSSQPLFTTPWIKGEMSSTELSTDGKSLYFRAGEAYFIYDLVSKNLVAKVAKSLGEGRLTLSLVDAEAQSLVGHWLKPQQDQQVSIQLVSLYFGDKPLADKLQTLLPEVVYDFSDDLNQMVTKTDLNLTKISASGEYYAYSEDYHLKIRHLPTDTVLFDRYRTNLSHLVFDAKSGKLIIADDLGYIEVFDLKQRAIIGRFKAIDAKINTLKLAGNYLMVLGANEIINLFTLHDLAPVVSLAPRGQDDMLILNPKGYYYATRNAAQLGVAFRVGYRVFPFDQFDLTFNRPDKTIEPLVSLGITSESLATSFSRAYEKRLARHGLLNEGAKGDLALGGKLVLPELSISDDALVTNTTRSQISLNYQALSKGTKLARLNVWVNNVPVYGRRGIKLKGYKRDGSITIPLSSGRNRLQLSVTNSAGLESLNVSADIYRDAQVEAKTHVIVIGASEYLDASKNLTFAAKDAGDIGAKFSADSLVILTNQQVIKAGVRALKTALLKTSVDDTVILFYAGHGMLNDELDYFLGTYDIDFSNPADKGLDYSTLEYLFDGIPARNRLMLIDACHSGEADKSEKQALVAMTTIEGLSINNFISARGFDAFEEDATSETAPQLGLDNSFELSKQLFADIRKGAGITVISASGSAEFAYEYGDLSNGVFTYSVLEGLDQNKADTNKDGDVSVTELQTFVKHRVVELTGGMQQPTFRAENLQNDWPLSVNE